MVSDTLSSMVHEKNGFKHFKRSRKLFEIFENAWKVKKKSECENYIK